MNTTIFGSSPRSPFGPSHHKTERRGEEHDQRKKAQNLENDFELEWIYVLWVPWRNLSKREREREREREQNTSQPETKNRKEKILMHEKCMNM